MIGIYKDDLVVLIRKIVADELNRPIPEFPQVGSMYDVLKDLDSRLPDRGELLTDAKANEMGLQKSQNQP